MISEALAAPTERMANWPEKVCVAAEADPAKVSANCVVIYSKDLVFRSALLSPTPKRVSAVLLPR